MPSYLLRRNAKASSSNLHHLYVQSLAHLNAAVRQQHRSIRVHMHQGPGLSIA